MAIIVCPECGEKISDTVKQCVHCGVKIIVCPECGKIHTSNVSICTECGFAIEKPLHNKVECKTSKEVMENWEKAGFVNKYVYSNYINLGLAAVTALFFIIAAIRLIVWNDIFISAKVLSTINTLLIFFVIFYIIRSTYSNLCEHIKTTMVALWCKQNNIDLDNVISNTLKIDFDAMTVEAAGDMLGTSQWCCRAAAYSRNVWLRTSSKKYNAIKIVLSSITAIFFAIFCSTNVEIYMGAKVLGSGFKLSMIEGWWAFIIAAIAFIINYFVGQYIERIQEEGTLKDIEQNLPELLHAYKTYVSSEQMTNYILKRSGISEK